MLLDFAEEGIINMKKIIAFMIITTLLIMMNTFTVNAYENNDTVITKNGLQFKMNAVNEYVFTGVADTSLTSIILPSQINGIPVIYENMYIKNGASVYNLFADCTELNEFIVEDNNTEFYTIDGVLFTNASVSMFTETGVENIRGQMLVCFPPGRSGSYSIPSGTKSISKGAFSKCSRLVTVTINDDLLFADRWAFSECGLLKTINGGLPINYSDTFNTCHNLKKITLKGVLSDIKLIDFPMLEELNFLKDSCFALLNPSCGNNSFIIKNCPKLQKLIIPNKTDEIGTSNICIQNCNSLEMLCLYGEFNLMIKDCESLRAIYTYGFSEETCFEITNIFELNDLPSLKELIICESNSHAIFQITDCPLLTVYVDRNNVELIGTCQVSHIPCMISSSTKGDINMDGLVDIIDVIFINKFLLGCQELNNNKYKVADFDGDGFVDSLDSLLLLKYVLGIDCQRN